MKVMCINNGPLQNSKGNVTAAPELTEGELYTCLGFSEVNKAAYILKEVQPVGDCYAGFNHKRFIPLSDLDETEMTREYQTQTV